MRTWEFESPRGQFGFCRIWFDRTCAVVTISEESPAPRRPCRGALAPVGTDLSVPRSAPQTPTVYLLAWSSSSRRLISRSTCAFSVLWGSTGPGARRSKPRRSVCDPRTEPLQSGLCVISPEGGPRSTHRTINFVELGADDRVEGVDPGGFRGAGALRSLGCSQEPAIPNDLALDLAGPEAGCADCELTGRGFGPTLRRRGQRLDQPIGQIQDQAVLARGESTLLVRDHPRGRGRGRLDRHESSDCERGGRRGQSMRLASKFDLDPEARP